MQPRRSKARFLHRLILSTAAGLILTGCVLGPRQSVRFDPRAESLSQAETEQLNRGTPSVEMLTRPSEDYLLGAGDEVVIYRLNARSDDPNASLKTFIMPDGNVYFDLAPPTLARGKTVTELSRELTEALRPYYKRPDVAVALHAARSRRYSILGKVYTPNVYPLNQPTTLLDAIARAGGLELAGGTGTTEELADLSRSILVRNNQIQPIDFEALVRRGDMRFNIYVRDQDFIFLPPKSTKEILVLGHVGTPKAVGWREGMGLVAAISEAQGIRAGAYVQRVLLVRGSFSQPEVAILNFDSIVKGKHTDVMVEAGDIIWVPRTPWERIERYIDVVLGTAVETIAANEGLRIIEGTDESVGVNISLNPGASEPAPPPVFVE